jgi:hypothetical protein
MIMNFALKTPLRQHYIQGPLGEDLSASRQIWVEVGFIVFDGLAEQQHF